MQKRNDYYNTREMKYSRKDFESQNVRNDSVPCQPGCNSGKRFPKRTIRRGRIFPIWILEERVVREPGNQIAERIGSVHAQNPTMKNIVIDIASIKRSHEQEHDDKGECTADDDHPGWFAGGLMRGAKPHKI